MNILLTNPEIAIKAIAIGMAKHVLERSPQRDQIDADSFEAGMIVGMTAMWHKVEKACSESDALLVAMLDDRS